MVGMGRMTVKTSGYAMGTMVAVMFHIDGAPMVGKLTKVNRGYEIQWADGSVRLAWSAGRKVYIRTVGNDFTAEVEAWERNGVEASKVETSSAEDRATAYAKRHHLTKDDAAFIASEIETTTNDEGHGFSGHSRRPMECRLCGEPAEVHSTTTDEGSSRAMWVKARTPLVTDHVKAWSGRTARVLEAIAELGGTVDAWDLGSGRGWHKTAVRIVMDSGVLVEADPSEELAKTYVLSDMGRQACEWYGFTIAEPVKPATVEIHKPADPIPANPEPFSDRDMRDQIVAYLGSDVDAYYVDGIVDHLIRTHNGAINIDDVDAGSWHRVVAVFHKPTEADVWAGTGTLVKPPIRTALGRRKRKATKKARRAVKGGF